MAKNKLAPKGLAKQRSLVSIVIPCFCESKNLPILYDRMLAALKTVDFDWELILIDDHSPDDTYAVASSLAAKDKRLRVFRLARNSGSHVAIACGLEFSRGDAAVALAADLQDPPELVLNLVEKWKAGAQVVWAIREESVHEGFFAKRASGAYWFMLSRMLPQSALPLEGADCFLLDRSAVEALNQCRETNFNIVGMIIWLGFRQTSIHYMKQKRIHGKTGWTFRKKIRQVIDSLTSFSHIPLRLISLVGVSLAFLGLAFAITVIIRYIFFGNSIVGWSSLMVAVLLLSGLQMIMLGIIGEYLWRCLDESRRRPRYIIEQSSDASHHS
jgi:polyisoprenyl-phosphate glycosyltransferase